MKINLRNHSMISNCDCEYFYLSILYRILRSHNYKLFHVYFNNKIDQNTTRKMISTNGCLMDWEVVTKVKVATKMWYGKRVSTKEYDFGFILTQFIL